MKIDKSAMTQFFRFAKFVYGLFAKIRYSQLPLFWIKD